MARSGRPAGGRLPITHVLFSDEPRMARSGPGGAGVALAVRVLVIARGRRGDIFEFGAGFKNGIY